MRRTMRLTLCAAAGLALAAPTAAQAATKSVTMGATGPTTKTLQEKYFSDAAAFFPSSISVRVGDSVRFVPAGFHSTHFLGRSGKAKPVVVAASKTIAGVADAAGVPFGFNGKPELNFNPLFFRPGNLGKTVVTNGTKEFNSGLPFSNRPKPMTVRFTKAGLFRYICDIHAGMKGSVRVVGRTTSVPSARADAARVKSQVAKATAVAKGFSAVTAPANTVNVGLYGRGGVSLFGFSPSTLSVPVGTTVTFRAATGNDEIHTATFGPGNPEKEPTSYLGKIAKSFENDDQPPQIGINPSDGGTVPLHSAALHGNGFWNTGVIDGVGLTSVLGKSQQVRFGQAGTFDFYCIVHPFMKGTITVQ